MPPLLQVELVTKSFGSTAALRNANLTLHRGEIHALVGENGAGKSTLMKILAGVHRKDAGRVFLDGKEIHPASPREAQRLGISTVFQELSLCPNLSIAENIYANREPAVLGMIRRKELHRQTEEYLWAFDIATPPEILVQDLNIAQQQVVEILKAISVNAKVLILDEPTSSLERTEVERLFGLLRKLKESGTGIIFITHKLNEVFQIADCVTVFRDGEYIVTKDRNETSEGEIIRFMVGREIQQIFPQKVRTKGREQLRVSGFKDAGKFRGISFDVSEGEILGVAGLTGSGRSEMMQSLFGYRAKEAGSVWLRGEEVRIDRPNVAIRNGMVYSPEDRKAQGLFLQQSVAMNVTSTCLEECSTSGFLSRKKERSLTSKMVNDLSIKVDSIDGEVAALSGGNQQKVLLAKCLAPRPGLLIVDEPTRGIDIGSKIEIYHLLDNFVNRGGSVILISSELSEIIGLSDRVIVFKEGQIVGELTKDISESSIMNLMFGNLVGNAKS